jgi:LmbE family N-acetylglucosaminyl deacetylase
MASILAFHAHPDDIETLAAGTLALLAAAGHRVVLATATAGEVGAVDVTPEEMAAIRKGEGAASAAVIGAAFLCAGLPDFGVFSDDASRRRITEVVRSARPDIVITAAVEDYHPDHEAVSQLVRDACFVASAANYVTGTAAPLPAIPHLYFMDPIGGRLRDGTPATPHFAVDISDWMGAKEAMLRAHASQGEWLRRQHGIDDHPAAMRAFAERRGADYGVRYAEGFRQYRNQPYPKTQLLQDLVGEALLQAPAA